MSPRLACAYLNLPLRSPVVIGACHLTTVPETLRQFVVGGAGAVVLPSIFQEQILDRSDSAKNKLSPPELIGREQSYNGGPDRYLAIIDEVKRSMPIPVIASMNGYDDGDWLDFARQIEAQGADALELNIQPLLVDPRQTADAIEKRVCQMVRRVCGSVAIPVAVKMTRHYTSVANMAHRFQQAGATGVVLFAHEVKWEVAIDRLRWTTHWELTPIDSLAPTLAGIIQARTGGLDLSVAASGGVRTAEDAIKAMIAGADVVMVTSEIYRSGAEAIRGIVQGIDRYLELGGYPTLAHFHKVRPVPESRTQQAARQDYLEPLTRSDTYTDPTPVARHQAGDRYGHPA